MAESSSLLDRLEVIKSIEQTPAAKIESQILAIIENYLTSQGSRLCLSCRRRLARAAGLPEPQGRADRGRPAVSIDRVRLAALRASGASLRAIAGELGVSKSTVARLLRSTEAC